MKKQSQGVPANLYIRWRDMSAKDFLLHVSGRDTPKFWAQFARWLATECPAALVRVCFDAEPERQVAAWHEELMPARWKKHLTCVAAETDPKRRAVLVAQKERIWPEVERERFRAELHRRGEQFSGAYASELVKVLETNDPAAQIAVLNQHLKERELVQPRPKVNRNRPPKQERAACAAEPPSVILLEEVEFDYYYTHPEVRRDRKLAEELTWNRELGGDVARAFARKEIPYEAFALEELALALSVMPKASSGGGPVWATLMQKGLRALLKAEWVRGGDEGHNAKLLREYVGTLLSEHLRHFGRRELRWFTNARQLALACRDARTVLTGNDPARTASLRLIHRAARHNRNVINALWFFFTHGLPPDELRTRPGLLAKLTPTWVDQDVPLLVRFLFQSGNKRKGLVSQWVVDDAADSGLRLKLADARFWTHSVKQHREGRAEADYFEELEAMAGQPPSRTEDVKEARLKARQLRRARAGLHYPD